MKTNAVLASSSRSVLLVPDVRSFVVAESIHLHPVLRDFRFESYPPQNGGRPVALLHSIRKFGSRLAH